MLSNIYIGLHVKCPLFLSDVLWNLNILDLSVKNMQIPNLIKIRPVGAELFHAYGRTDMMELRVAFSNFANAPTNLYQRHFVHHISHTDCTGVEPGVLTAWAMAQLLVTKREGVGSRRNLSDVMRQSTRTTVKSHYLTMGTRSFPRVESGRGVTLDPSPPSSVEV
jgi:hypothetical protein